MDRLHLGLHSAIGTDRARGSPARTIPGRTICGPLDRTIPHGEWRPNREVSLRTRALSLNTITQPRAKFRARDELGQGRLLRDVYESYGVL